MGIKLLSYNVRLNRPSYPDYLRAANLRELIISGNWDIIGLCEVYSELQRKVMLEDKKIQQMYPYQVHSSGMASFFKYDIGIVILSKFPILNYEINKFENSTFEPPPFSMLTNKGFVFCEIKINKRTLGIVMLHLHWGLRKYKADLRRKQLIELREYLDFSWDLLHKPTIIMGDFNFWDSKNTDELKVMNEIFPELIDTWNEVHNIEKNPGNTWSKENTFVFVPLRDMRFDFVYTNNLFYHYDMKLLKPKANQLWVNGVASKTLSNKERIWLGLNLIFQIIIFPVILPLHLIRLVLGLPVGVFGNRDLSDHYGIEAKFEIKSKSST